MHDIEEALKKLDGVCDKIGVEISDHLAAANAAKMRVAAIPDRRFVDPREYEREADYLLNNLSEISALI